MLAHPCLLLVVRQVSDTLRTEYAPLQLNRKPKNGERKKERVKFYLLR